ncbi:MAG: alanyl-tRNA editing protein [Rhodospirillaceae bacterium]|nr:alanyl-tRNA editing protein [Rhodospirillaceae bacterium]
MTEELFRQDAYLNTCEATVLSSGPDGIVLDRTVFYPVGGGQPGDSGSLTWDGGTCAIADTVKAADGTAIAHIPADGAVLPPAGTPVTAAIDWDRRHRHMRMHTAMHLVCAVVTGDVTGGQVGADKSRLDFNLPAGAIDKDAIAAAVNGLIAANHPVTARWIADAELAARPELVRTMSVKPPIGSGRVRLLQIGPDDAPVDLQPCGGTHVAATGEIGPITVGKVENKGKQNRRINILLG